MNKSEYERIGLHLVNRFGTRDPFAIAKGLGIRLYWEDFKDLKGMYRVIKRNRCIFINQNLSPTLAKIVCAHELGHDQLHRAAASDGFQEFMLYDMNSRREYEANMVAAAILLPTDEVLSYIYEFRYDAEQIARAMRSDINLVALKVADLRDSGYELRGLDYNSKFLK